VTSVSKEKGPDRPGNSTQAPASSRNRTGRETNGGYDYAKLFAVAGDPLDDPIASANARRDQDFNRFQDRLRSGKVKLCGSCGGVMTRSSRRILSMPAGLGLIALGACLMALYGFATNFAQPPWHLKFMLPAAYYLGSIFVGVGVLFFFIRERVWICPKCKEISKR